MGLLAGIEFVRDRARRASFEAAVGIGKRVAAACRQRGLRVRPLGSMIGISPPLTLSRAEIDTLAGVLRESIRAVGEQITAEGLSAS